MLQLEEHLLEDVAAADGGRLTGTLALGASTGPGAHLVPLLLCEFQREHPDLRVALSIWDTHAVIERVADREVELGRRRGAAAASLPRLRAAGAGRDRARGAAGPSGRRRRAARGRAPRRDARGHAGGRRRPPGRRGGAASGRPPAAQPGAEARARSAGVREERGRGRLRRHVHLAHRDRGRARGRDARDRARRRARAVAPALRRASEGPAAYARGRGVPRVRAGSARRDRPLGPRRLSRGAGRARRSSGRCSSRRAAGTSLDLPAAGRFAGCRQHVPRETVDGRSPRPRAARRARRARRRQRDRHGQGRQRRDRAAGRLDPDDVLRSRVDVGLRRPRRGARDQARRRRRACRGDRLRAGADARPPARARPAGRR